MNTPWGVLKLRSRGGAIAHDLLMIPAAWLGALWLRFNLGSIPPEFLDQALRLLPMVVLVNGAIFLYFGLYRGVWRFASLPDLVRILQAVVVGVLLCAFATFFMTRMSHVPRSLYPLFAILLIVLLSGPRLTYRWFKDRWLRGEERKAVLIVGAGKAGEMLARSLLRESSRGYRPIGFVDDDPEKLGREIRGIRVLGHCGRIPAIAAGTAADVIALAIPSASMAQRHRIVTLCERTNVPVRTIPYAQDFLYHGAGPDTLRELAIEDLLDRRPARFDWPAIRHELTAHAILVTGGGGSIGSELCRQIARLDPSHLVIADVSESNLHGIRAELCDAYPALRLTIVLADVCDAHAMRELFERHRPEIVFHAAAYKQVPMLEAHPREAIRVNVLGTQTVLRAAMAHSAERFVLVSSDKAVDPANVMGASKRLAEMTCRAGCDTSSSTLFIVVRFGNVLDSVGSVVPLFREQIARGGPVTVTDPDMERYFMTIPEASQLVLAAAALGKGGEVFVLDMGEPVRIAYLAEQMIRFAGKVPGKDVAIEFVGRRAGEKLSEELFEPGESPAATSHDKILLARSRPIRDVESFEARLAELREACETFDEPRLRSIFAALVPGYSDGQPPAGGAFRNAPRRATGLHPPASAGYGAPEAAENVVSINQITQGR